MPIPDDDKTDQNAELTELAGLRGKLARLVADDLEAVIGFQMPAPGDPTKAVVTHRQRTARYKTQQLLALAPDSQAVAQSCAYLVLSLLEAEATSAPLLRKRLVSILSAAGYERSPVLTALARLSTGVGRRRAMWERMQLRKMAVALASAIRQLG